jgi:MoaA/NifB/PqqE/SkfB family radical SAM enzyme
VSTLPHALSFLSFLCGREPPVGPAKVGWEVTYRCDSRCLSCQRWRQQSTDELPTSDARTIVERLAEGGVLSLSFTGGEPLLRQDLEELVALAAQRGMSTSLSTNALQLTDSRIRGLAQAGLGTVFLSVDGARPETHDRVRGRRGSHERVLRAAAGILALGKPRPRVVFNLTVNGLNLSELVEVGDLAAEMGVDGFTLQPLHSADDVSLAPARGLMPRTEQLAELDVQIARLARRHASLLPGPPGYIEGISEYFRDPDALYRYRCVAGHHTAVLDPVGEMYPCPLEFRRMGSLREGSLREVWWSKEARAVRDAVRRGRHPICWFNCVAPLNVVATAIARGRPGRALTGALLRHVARRATPPRLRSGSRQHAP